jgi:Helix-turn-helix domain
MSFESGDRHPRERLLDNPVAIRAIAHPVRLALIGLVSREGPTTSAEAARELGISQALASHHMRQLAKYGFLEPAAQRNGRDRPWQVTAVTTSWRGAGGDPQMAAAADVLEQLLAEQAVAKLLDWQERRGQADPGWRDVTGVSAHLIYLTMDELTELSDALDALVTPLVQRRQPGDARPAGAVPVDLTTLVSVLRPTSLRN